MLNTFLKDVVKVNSKVEKRRREILNIIETEGKAYIVEIAKLFGVTKETIRNDFDFLSITYGLDRTHGGLEKEYQDIQKEHYQYQEKKLIHIEEKKRICYKMVDMLDNGDCIYVDSGSTVSYILNYINRKREITIVTPSIAILTRFVQEGFDSSFEDNKHKLIFIGGQVSSSILTTYGPFFDDMINDFNFDKMIFSADAIDLKGGITDSDDISYSIVKKVSEKSRENYLLIDNSKFGLISTYRVIQWNEVNVVISNENMESKWQNLLETNKIKYIKA